METPIQNTIWHTEAASPAPELTIVAVYLSSTVYHCLLTRPELPSIHRQSGETYRNVTAYQHPWGWKERG